MTINKPYKNREWLFNQYIELDKPITTIAEECNVSSSTIYAWILNNHIDIKPRKKIDPYIDDYHSGMFPNFTNKQLFQTTHHLIMRLLKGIRELKGETNILDVGGYQFSVELLKELKKRLGISD